MEDSKYMGLIFQHNRYQIIKALVKDTKSLSELSKEVGLSKQTTIFHLNKLEKAGIVLSEIQLHQIHAVRMLSLSRMFFDKFEALKQLILELG